MSTQSCMGVTLQRSHLAVSCAQSPRASFQSPLTFFSTAPRNCKSVDEIAKRSRPLGVRRGRLALGRTATSLRPLYRPVRYIAGIANAAGARFFLMASLWPNLPRRFSRKHCVPADSAGPAECSPRATGIYILWGAYWLWIWRQPICLLQDQSRKAAASFVRIAEPFMR
jgi:hypothetical protein